MEVPPHVCVTHHARVRRDLPSGTVTFLFTDVEGSTKLLRRLGAAAYAEALAEHRRILRGTSERHGGIEVDTQGDAFFVAFPTAPGALAAAAEAMEGLASGPIRVRVGIHTGTPHVDAEGYVGMDVHRAARIAACGHGGQVLVSASTAALSGVEGLRDLGEHRLKDLSAPERLYQAGDGEFPPLKSLYRTNLPVPATPFLGREHELAEVLDLLEAGRLLTLTGPGGTGKTRLGLQAAAEASDRYPDGVFWVPLAPLRDASLVLETAGQALGAQDGLAEHVAEKSLLLLLDNFEHVVEAADALGDLLAACPNLRLLVTSREVLRLPAEQAYPVPPLEPQDGTDLFVARAQAVDPAFVTSAAVAALCARLEQLPLALELAAARVRVLSPEQLLDRLSRRLDVLKAGRGVDPRQQTLRATIEWSHDLLTEDEHRLFARLAVFRGGCTLESAEEVCDADLDILQSLVDKSLLRHSGERFWMLETIREFARERLDESGDESVLRRRHADWYLALAERADRLDDVSEGSPRIAAEDDNLRRALAWARDAGEDELLLRLVAALAGSWRTRGLYREARVWLALALERGSAPPEARMRVLDRAWIFAVEDGDLARAEALVEERRRIAERTGNEEELLGALNQTALLAAERGDLEGARADLLRVKKLAAELGDRGREAGVTVNLGVVAHRAGDFRASLGLLRSGCFVSWGKKPVLPPRW